MDPISGKPFEGVPNVTVDIINALYNAAASSIYEC